ncbi:MAG: DUF2178 domain-containing protein [Methanocorpusculum sp.]|nr:DUF2178 domain-containing protein [Methanocorpusculum sp.]
MKKNTFYIICGFIAIALVLLFILSINLSNPFIIAGAIVVAGILFFICRHKVTDVIMDERQMFIGMKTAAATIKTAIILFLTLNIAIVVYVFSGPLGFHNFRMERPVLPEFPQGAMESVSFFPVPPDTIPISQLGMFAIGEIILFIVILFVYVGFRYYYSRKYGGEEEDEE